MAQNGCQGNCRGSMLCLTRTLISARRIKKAKSNFKGCQGFHKVNAQSDPVLRYKYCDYLGGQSIWYYTQNLIKSLKVYCAGFSKYFHACTFLHIPHKLIIFCIIMSNSTSLPHSVLEYFGNRFWPNQIAAHKILLNHVQFGDWSLHKTQLSGNKVLARLLMSLARLP